MPRTGKVLTVSSRGGGGGRSRDTTTAGGGASSSSATTTSNRPRIVIKPFSKPPTLPVDFYETTSERLLQGTLLAARLGGANVADDPNTSTTLSTSSPNNSNNNNFKQPPQKRFLAASPQTWYSSVVDLVAHQLGPRLYQDLQKTMALATRRVLPEDHPFTNLVMTMMTMNSSSSGGISNMDAMIISPSTTTTAAASSAVFYEPSLLHYVQTQYQRYLDYVVLCQHVFLPLDQTHFWIPPNHVIKRSSSSSSAPITTSTTAAAGMKTTDSPDTSHPSSTSGSWSGKTVTTTTTTKAAAPSTASYTGSPQCLWQVALDQFRCRLETLQLLTVIYQAWWQALRQDWLEGGYTSGGGGNASTAMSGGANSNTFLLQSTLFMWQDLQVLPLMLQSLQADLEMFFTQLALQHQQQQQQQEQHPASSSYRPDRFISYVYQKWMHVSYQWTFLPRTWLRTLIEVHLLQPHLTNEWLLHADHVTMLLEEDEINQLDTTANAQDTTRTSRSSQQPPPPHWVQLWMLAGRLPEGHKSMTTALCHYTKTKGLAIVHQAFASPAAAKTMIGNLLVMQRRMIKWQQRLIQISSSSMNPGMTSSGGNMSTSSSLDALKHVWEDIVNVAHPNNSNIVAECLAKYMDPLLRSTKMELESSTGFAVGSVGPGSPMAVVAGNNNAVGGTPTTSTTEHPTIYQIQQQVLQLFVYLQAKDVFEAFYKKDLAKRLLWNRVVSMDVERHFVTLLKTECGAGYTSKMEGMFADVELSRETMNRYKQQQLATAPATLTTTATAAASVEMEVQVLTTGYWPVYPQLPHLVLPASLLSPQEQFASYYRDKYQGRRITWQYALGHVLVRGNYPPCTKGSTTTVPARQYEFVVSLCQALVLLQFNLGDNDSGVATTKRWTLPQLQRAIGVEDRDEMERILQSLSLGKDGTRVLRKLDHDAGGSSGTVARVAGNSGMLASSSPPSLPSSPPPPPAGISPATPGRAKKVRMNVDDQDVFIVDEKFRSQQRRIRINNILWKETMEEREKTVESVSRDRLYLIDAVLVRILKARKTISHPQLMQQVMEQVKVPAQASDIKKRIESLIEREYMERDADDRNRYNYLA